MADMGRTWGGHYPDMTLAMSEVYRNVSSVRKVCETPSNGALAALQGVRKEGVRSKAVTSLLTEIGEQFEGD